MSRENGFDSEFRVTRKLDSCDLKLLFKKNVKKICKNLIKNEKNRKEEQMFLTAS